MISQSVQDGEDGCGRDVSFGTLPARSSSAFGVRLVESLMGKAGLLIERMCYGSRRKWPRKGLRGRHVQDVVISRPVLPREFDPVKYLAIHKDVAAAGMIRRSITSRTVEERTATWRKSCRPSNSQPFSG